MLFSSLAFCQLLTPNFVPSKILEAVASVILEFQIKKAWTHSQGSTDRLVHEIVVVLVRKFLFGPDNFVLGPTGSGPWIPARSDETVHFYFCFITSFLSILFNLRQKIFYGEFPRYEIGRWTICYPYWGSQSTFSIPRPISRYI